jgi:anaerobic magnesium-protoporphyrin IX monomethyl ester cyclase
LTGTGRHSILSQSTSALISMNTVFVFTPQASPSYTPIGLASLSAYMAAHHPAVQFRTLDLNLETWNAQLKQLYPSTDVEGFIRKNDGDFFSDAVYRRYLAVRATVAERIDALHRDVRVYVETGGLSSEAERFLSACMNRCAEAGTVGVLGFSVMFPKQLLFSLAIARYAKLHLSPLKIVFGGAAISFLEAEELLSACPYIDGLVIGEGERAVGVLGAGGDVGSAPGYVSRSGSGFRRNPKPDTLSMSCLPYPDFSCLRVEGYWNPAPVLPVLFSRGCRWRKCRFCAHNFSFSGYRTRGVSGFVDHLEEYAARYGARHFYFADQYIDVLGLEAIAEELIRRNADFRFHCMGRPTPENTARRLEKLYRAGLRWVSWGVETGSQRLLDLCGKGTFVHEIADVLKHSGSAGINNLLMMMFGLPTGTDEDLEQTFRFLEILSAHIHEMKESVFCLMKNTGFAKNPKNYGMRITGATELFSAAGVPVHSFKLTFREIGTDGTSRPPRGPLELELWQKRKKWLFEDSLLSLMSAEHYLLAVSDGFPSHRSDAGAPERSPTLAPPAGKRPYTPAARVTP